MADAENPASLLLLPPQLLGEMWPPEKVICGTRACRQLRDALFKHARNIEIQMRACNMDNTENTELRDSFKKFFNKIEGKVQIKSDYSDNLTGLGDVMQGKVDGLHLTPTDNDRNKNIIHTVAQCMPGLRVLSMHGPMLQNFVAQCFLENVCKQPPANYTNLEELRLVQMDFRQNEWDDVLACVRCATALRELRLQFCRKTEYKALSRTVGQAVGALSQLRTLHVTRWLPRTPEFMTGLRETGAFSTTLERLSLDDCSFGDDARQLCELLAARPSLTALSLLKVVCNGGNAYAISEQVARMTGLTDLRVDKCIKRGGGDLGGCIAECRKLCTLHIVDMTLTGPELLALVQSAAACTRLRELHVNRVVLSINTTDTITEGLAQGLAALPALKRLDFSDTALTDEETAALHARLTHVRDLRF